MADPAALSNLVSAIYDASLDPDLWQQIVERTSRFVGGFSACISIQDDAAAPPSIYTFGDIPDQLYGRLYWETYRRLDPRDWSLLTVGAVRGNAMFLPLPEFRQTRFYREWMQPQGIGDNPICVLDRTDAGSASFGVFVTASQGDENEQAFERMRLITPHLRRAVLITRSMQLRKAEATALADTLDGIAAAVILLDRDGCVVHANASGRRLLVRRSPLNAVKGKILANSAEDQRRLNQCLAAATESSADAGETFAVKGSENERYLVHVLPLTSSARKGVGNMFRAVAAMFVHEVKPPPTSRAWLIAEQYKLTPAEVRVLLAIAECGGVKETAEALGVAQTTVKTHLQRVFSKTDCSRQAELVKLVASFSSPLIR
jgi:DNA-binding CsgD family transcriptional regulator/PAS domain-containing protein